ncbi:MAG: hypothetical protein HYT70_03720 [Candidatus Aenigmarchaeota archaeon]|nr:hypothetical protein [Candidatus Aenigmarchaeota archaeon]
MYRAQRSRIVLPLASAVTLTTGIFAYHDVNGLLQRDEILSQVFHNAYTSLTRVDIKDPSTYREVGNSIEYLEAADKYRPETLAGSYINKLKSFERHLNHNPSSLSLIREQDLLKIGLADQANAYDGSMNPLSLLLFVGCSLWLFSQLKPKIADLYNRWKRRTRYIPPDDYGLYT